MQQPFSFALPQTSWKPPEAHELPSWKDAKRVAIDVETKDLQLRTMGPGVRRSGNRVVGISFAIEDGPSKYLSISHDGGDNCQFDVWAYVKEQIRDFRGTIVGNGVNYDQDWIVESTKDEAILSKSTMDIQCADVLIDENQMSYALEKLCERYGLPGKDEEALRQAAQAYGVDPKVELFKLPARYAAAYGIGDVEKPLKILRKQERLIESEGVAQIWALEQKVTPILVKLRRRGVRVDMDKVGMIERRSLEVETEELQKVHHATGVKLAVGDVWKAEALARALKAAGFNPPRTPKGKDSIDKIFLKMCGPIGASILRAREWNKLRTTFCKQVREHAIYHGRDSKGEHWRVHCTFHQLRSNSDEREGEGRGVRYGRFSSTDFNFQQQPVRHKEFGDLWRSVFIADEGCEWVCSDWSQQEPRIGVHYAEKLGLQGAKEFADEYRRNPDLDVHQALADISKMERVIVKNFVNGRLYGMGDLKLCIAIGEPTVKKTIKGVVRDVPGPGGQAKIRQFDQFAPWIRGLVRAAAEAAKKKLHVWTILRRKCRMIIVNGEVWETHKAFNRIGQGSAADQMKATLVAADAEGIPVQAVVHDEFDFSRPRGDRRMSERLRELQMNTVRFSVPMKCDVEVGENWGELTKEKMAA